MPQPDLAYTNPRQVLFWQVVNTCSFPLVDRARMRSHFPAESFEIVITPQTRRKTPLRNTATSAFVAGKVKHNIATSSTWSLIDCYILCWSASLYNMSNSIQLFASKSALKSLSKSGYSFHQYEVFTDLQHLIFLFRFSSSVLYSEDVVCCRVGGQEPHPLYGVKGVPGYGCQTKNKKTFCVNEHLLWTEASPEVLWLIKEMECRQSSSQGSTICVIGLNAIFTYL